MFERRLSPPVFMTRARGAPVGHRVARGKFVVLSILTTEGILRHWTNRTQPTCSG